MQLVSRDYERIVWNQDKESRPKVQMSGLGVALETCTANTLKREARGAGGVKRMWRLDEKKADKDSKGYVSKRKLIINLDTGEIVHSCWHMFYILRHQESAGAAKIHQQVCAYGGG